MISVRPCLLRHSLFLVAAFSSNAFGLGFDYFLNKSDKPETSKQTPLKQKKSFDWKKILDPMDESLEFFKEGDHVPPKPYIEMFRDPSDKNIKNWFSLMEKKNELSKRLSKKIGEYLTKNKIPQPFGENLKHELTQKLNMGQMNMPDIRRYKIRLYFHSSCPHCKRMIKTIKELSNIGYYIEVRQVDNNLKVRKHIPFPVRKATSKELKSKKINSWPVLLIADLKTKKIFRINGYQNTSSIIKQLRRNL